jgi:hypothetical protein
VSRPEVEPVFGRQLVRIGALLVSIVTIMVGIVGIASPDLLTAIRHQYFATPIGLYCVGALRVAMGIVVILVAPTSRAPKTLRALGTVIGLQGLTAMLAGPERARAILEWEVMQGPSVLRVGAAGALAAGSFLAFAVMARRTKSV